MVASADGQRFRLHTAAGDRTFLPGVDLGTATPGHPAGELSVSAAQYRAWFAAMSWLGIRVVRNYTIHPPAFYQQLAEHNRAEPDRPLYLMQGVRLPDESYLGTKNLYDRRVTEAFRQEIKDATRAVSGELTRTAAPGRAGGTWKTDVTPWLAGWIIGAELDPYAAKASDRRNADAKRVSGEYFRSSSDASPTERWLAARMDELAGLRAAEGVSEPIAFVNWPATDPLRHPEEPRRQEDLLQLDANHVLATEAWPAGTFASYHAYPYYPDFLRHEPALQAYQYGGRSDPYAGYLAALRQHHAAMPTLVTEFGVPSSIGSAHNGPLGRGQGDHSETEAMRIDAELLRLIRDQGLEHRRPSGRCPPPAVARPAHQQAGLRPAGDGPGGPARRGGADPGRRRGGVAGASDHRPGRRGIPAPAGRAGRLAAGIAAARLRRASGPDRYADGRQRRPAAGCGVRAEPGGSHRAGVPAGRVGTAATGRYGPGVHARAGTGRVEAGRADPEPGGGRPGNLRNALILVSSETKLPVELQNAGLLRYGSWDPADPEADSRSLWHAEDDTLTVRVPWAMLGFADPSSRAVGVPRPPRLTTQVSPGVRLTLSASGTDQVVDQVSWAGWTQPYYNERLKQGAERFRDATLSVTGG